MSESCVTACEQKFAIQAARQNIRLDGRKSNEFRKLSIDIGYQWGCVLVTLGSTKVLANVSCEVGTPEATRPNEGKLFINVDLEGVAVLDYDSDAFADMNIHVNRMLERLIKDSRCVDLESLCVTCEERVWVLRVSLSVLNHEGNIVDCCSIAALAALLHFRRPDISFEENVFRVHTEAEKAYIPVVLHHYPVCVSYSVFAAGETAVVDPNRIEEDTAESKLIFGFNSYNEMCCLNFAGSTLANKTLLMQCARNASRRAKYVIGRVKKAIEIDNNKRASKEFVGFAGTLFKSKIHHIRDNVPAGVAVLHAPTLPDKNTTNVENKNRTKETAADESNSNQKKPEKMATQTVRPNWLPDDDESSEMEITSGTDVKIKEVKLKTISLSDSEEEDKMIL